MIGQQELKIGERNFKQIKGIVQYLIVDEDFLFKLIKAKENTKPL